MQLSQLQLVDRLPVYLNYIQLVPRVKILIYQTTITRHLLVGFIGTFPYSN